MLEWHIKQYLQSEGNYQQAQIPIPNSDSKHVDDRVRNHFIREQVKPERIFGNLRNIGVSARPLFLDEGISCGTFRVPPYFCHICVLLKDDSFY